MADSLETYRAKRDFSATAEPAGEVAEPAPDAPRFVVQEHHATRLHWDLRLERDGVLASWAVPNGLPQDPGENRKAVHTEDHPLEYLDFHGEIPAGEYGAGSMTIWDSGTYACEKWEPGKVVVVFAGERLRGRYSLFRAGRAEKDWMVHRMDPPEDPTREPMPERLVPMLARSGSLPRDDAGWAFEIKWDGIRALAYSEPGRLRLESRNLNDLTGRYPELRDVNRALSSHSAILDGEIVAFDEQGRPSFQRLQQRMHLTGESVVRRRAREAPVAYVIFDLLWLDGHSLLDQPYEERRERLAALELEGDAWQTPAYHRGEGAALLEATSRQGLEGVMAKRLDSTYEPGRRSNAWVKVKHTRRQELVIGGWLPGEGRRRDRLGALLVGYFSPDGELRYAGRVGTGFDEGELDLLGRELRARARSTSPFAGRTAPRGSAWVEPELVAEIEFNEWTEQGLLRHPSYKGLREDKPARDVVREDLGAADAPDATEPGEAPAPPADAPLPEEVAEPSAAVDPPEGLGLDALLATARPLAGGAVEATVAGRALRLSNVGKVLYPADGFTKGEMIDFYGRIAPVLLPHLSGRPLTLKRYPNGADAQHFFEKQCPRHRPDWVRTAAVWSRRNRAEINFCLADDTPTLIWLANLAALELHPSLSRAENVARPTVMVFDLDPGAPADILTCCEVGLWIRGMFDQLGLQSFPKTSGSKGLQLYVPLNSEVSYEQTKGFAKAVAETLEKRSPDLVVSEMAKAKRPGKVLVDWSQNDEHKTTVSVYSLRARERPTVSTPVSWEEVEDAHAAGDAGRLVFTAPEVLARVEAHGDLFAPVVSLVQALPGV